MTDEDRDARDPRASLPALTVLLRHPEATQATAWAGHERVVAALRRVLAGARDAIASGARVPEAECIVAKAVAALEAQSGRGLRPVINATGVLLHTNLGRAPLSTGAVASIAAAAGPTNLEVDLADGRRGGRGRVAHDALARLTGAEAALIVNNGAAALVLALHVLGRDREVVISRGELVEIGGSFRLPDIMEAAGCRLREVGTTNRTHLDDYRRAVTADTGAILRVHPSNFRQEGFVHRPSTVEIAEVAHAAAVPFIDDIGSGLLRAHPAAADEPVAATMIQAGADLVLFSGDKLLGGPQAGILVGRHDLVERCRRAPLARAMRLDKLRMAALESCLAAHERDARNELPVWAMAEADLDDLRVRTERIAAGCGGTAVQTEAVLGGGSTPGGRLPSWGVALTGSADDLSMRLRTGDPAVATRIVDDRVVADLRSVPADHDDALLQALRTATGIA